MKKIGLCIQFEKIDNFGTVLQALATVNVIEKLGVEPRVIRYKRKYTPKYIFQQVPRLFESSNWTWIKRSIRIRRGNTGSEMYEEYSRERKKAFSEFRKKYFPESIIDEYYGYEDLSNKSTLYDAVLVGSDQLWLPAGVKTNFYNLQFAKSGVNRISYSTSFGVSSVPQKQMKEYRNYLNKIDFLSVREKSGVEIVKQLTNRDAMLVCDPVLLLKNEEWEEIISDYTIPCGLKKEEYILCYFLGVNINARQEAERIAKERGLLLVPVIFMEDYIQFDESYGDVRPKGVTPEQFVKLIKNAAYVITDSFHGTAFSLLFEKQFVVVYRFSNQSKFSKNTRIDSILDKVNLSNRLCVDGNMNEIISNEINYREVNGIVENWRRESIDFLNSALEGQYATEGK